MATAQATQRHGLTATERARRAVFAECRKQGIDDATRHALIRNVGHVASGSAADMSASAAWRVVAHLRGMAPGAPLQRPTHEWSWVDTAAASRRPLLRKLIMLMKGTEVPRGAQVAYIEGIARQMSGLGVGAGPVEKPLAMCDEHELWRIVQALATHLRRRGIDPNQVEPK